MVQQAALPQKSREVRNHHLDSTVWNDLELRSGDVIVDTYSKSGTTWAQQIAGRIIFHQVDRLPINRVSFWLDSRVAGRANLARLKAQNHRRIIKSHLPVDALGLSALAKYLYVARDGRDVVWSLHEHHSRLNASYYRLFNQAPGRSGPPIQPPHPDVREYFRRWLDEDGYPIWSFWDHVRGWWQVRECANVLLLHFNDLRRDLEGQMRRIATFLEVDVPARSWPRLVEQCSFEYMKRHAEDVVPLGGFFEGGPTAFVNKGTNRRWRDVLTNEDIADYERTAREQLGSECASWLVNGAE